MTITVGYIGSGTDRPVKINPDDIDLTAVTTIQLRAHYYPIGGHPRYNRLPQFSLFNGGETIGLPSVEANALIAAGAAVGV